MLKAQTGWNSQRTGSQNVLPRLYNESCLAVPVLHSARRSFESATKQDCFARLPSIVLMKIRESAPEGGRTMPTVAHIEKHFTGTALVRDVVIGMSDGLTVPFALAAGISG